MNDGGLQYWQQLGQQEEQEFVRLGAIAKAKEIGKHGHEKYQWLACSDCKKERWVVLINNGTTPKSQLCVRCATAKFNRTRQGHKSPMWKGGNAKRNGYVMVYLPDGHPLESMRVGGTSDGRYRRYIAEHRLVMAEHLGRPLTTDEIVHHKDGNRANNELSNLELTNLGKHSKDHSKGYEHGFEQGYAAGLAAAKRSKK